MNDRLEIASRILPEIMRQLESGAICSDGTWDAQGMALIGADKLIKAERETAPQGDVCVCGHGIQCHYGHAGAYREGNCSEYSEANGPCECLEFRPRAGG